MRLAPWRTVYTAEFGSGQVIDALGMAHMDHGLPPTPQGCAEVSGLWASKA